MASYPSEEFSMASYPSYVDYKNMVIKDVENGWIVEANGKSYVYATLATMLIGVAKIFRDGENQ